MNNSMLTREMLLYKPWVLQTSILGFLVLSLPGRGLRQGLICVLFRVVPFSSPLNSTTVQLPFKFFWKTEGGLKPYPPLSLSFSIPCEEGEFFPPPPPPALEGDWRQSRCSPFSVSKAEQKKKCPKEGVKEYTGGMHLRIRLSSNASHFLLALLGCTIIERKLP
eukprot:Hpha_TRINITY_DN15744_c2_g1::TRINITY_DN15744_c2_g1_i1::g.37104::m.37104